MTDLKIIIPMAGIGRRLLPLTMYRPKPLVRLADKRLIDHVLYTFHDLEKIYTLEYVFIIGYLGEQIKEYMKGAHPDKCVTYYVQDQLMGQSHAIYLAKEAISGPTLLTYCDTVNKTDFSFIATERTDGVASVQEVEDPSRFGVAVVGPNNLIIKLMEKPKTMAYKSALTGIYYFSEGKELIKAIETQIERGLSLNNEYYLADAINILMENGIRIRTEKVLQWLDAGTPESIIEINSYLLEQYSASHNKMVKGQSNVFIHPVYIHESSRVENSIIGPNVAIGVNCTINGSIIKNTIIDDGCTITEATLINSLIGQGCCINGRSMQSIVADHDEIRIYQATDDTNTIHQTLS
jgi:glucose-1-phosphate thymidylyltransferase